jgi:O-antigen ligase
VVLGLSSRWSMVQSRFAVTVSEYHRYEQGNDETSLGSRFTMWKMGVMAFKEHPFGQTETGRNQHIKQYLLDHNQPNSWAFLYIDVHLHNEFIQIGSLAGIFGVLTLLIFFGVLMFSNGVSGFLLNPISMVALSTLLYGLTDVLLISGQYIVLFSIIILLSWLCCRSERQQA